MSDQVLAFAGAEGYGAYTVGGRGGEVVKVTNLEDSGPGSLRWALEEVEGPRTVVFEVNGVIALKQQILITDPNVTIAGQTSLGDGITIEGSRIRVKADDVIIRGLKFRPGDGETGMDAGDRDGLFIGTTEFRIDNVIVDHNSFTWGVDENVSINGFVKDVTISNNIIAEGLSQSIHPKGEHSKGLLISNWGSKESDVNTNISIVKNLFASNMQRNPEVRAGQEIEIVNNYIYNYGLAHTAMFIGAGTGGQLETTVHAIGNVFDPGPDTPNYKVPIALSSMGQGSGVFLSDNLWTKIGTDGAGNQAQVKMAWDQGGMKYVSDKQVFAGSNVKILDSQDVKAYVLANVGAAPGQRDAVDARIIASTGDKTGRIVDSVAEAGGPAANIAVRHATDSDGDGMPNWFEDVYGLDSRVANANGDNDRDGFTNVEEYINGLISGFDLPQSGKTTVTTLEDGAERIVVEALASGRHVIRNFNSAEGDKLDLSKLLTGYDPAIHKIEDFVEAVTVAGRTVISVDRDGAGGNHVMEYVGELDSVGPFGSLAEVILSKSAASAAQAPLRNVTAVADHLTVDKNGLLQLPTGILTLNDTKEGTGALIIDEVSNVTGGTVSFDEFGQIIFSPTANFTGIAGFQYRLKGVEGDGGRGQVTIDVMREITGGAGNDVITSGADRVRIDAGSGDDRITAGARDDVILAGAGQDNVLAGAGDDSVSGGDGDDRLLGGAGRDTLFGEAGNDTLYGEEGDDSLHGGAGADTLHGGNGNDTLFGDAGNDTLRAGAGNDTLHGGDGDDTILGETGDDTIEGGAGNDSITGGEGDDLASGGAGHDTLSLGNGNDVAFGDEGNDSLNGGAGDDVLYGDAGNDRIDGGVGNDLLYGGDGADILVGGDGSDWLFGGAGADRLSGGAGADVFAVERAGGGFDTIVDFAQGSDKIALRGADFGLDRLVLGDNLFIGTNAAATQAKASILYDQRSGYLSFDADGSGAEAATVLAHLGNRAVLLEHDLFLA